MTAVRTRDEAIALVDQALGTWSQTVTVLLTSAQHRARVAREQAEGVVREWARKVAAIEAVLSAAEGERARHLQLQLVQAREAHEQARRAYVRVSDAAEGVAQLARTHAAQSTPQVESARAQLAKMNRALESYRSAGPVLGEARSGRVDAYPGSRRNSTGHGHLSEMGLTALDVNAADLDANPVSGAEQPNGKFGKGGLTRADYRWAVQTWNDTVEPAVAAGKTREHFAERDARSNAPPLRRTADVYDLFLGSDRIRVDRRPDGSLSITNGRHRLLIARELGIKHLPGEISK